ncbi:hypothetical protein BD289DRAFT_159130 [Coniella lustricola]|uniref:Uncharacterized protein n=1 Tax=Coniella lustricola TaxID=2025994 RepID=A0A2T3AEP6_9PEZI|nr:hypothetical protein BD289DRAFT_159130 [Coniella lustricola]
MVSFNIFDRIVHPRRKQQQNHKKSYSTDDAALPTVSTRPSITSSSSSSSSSSYSRCTCRGSQYCAQCDDMASPIIPTTAGFQLTGDTNPFDQAYSLYHSYAPSSSPSSPTASSCSSHTAISAAERMRYQTSIMNTATKPVTTVNTTVVNRPRPYSTHLPEANVYRQERGLSYGKEVTTAGVSLWAVRRQSELP